MTPNSIDLTTLVLVKQWLSANGIPPTNTQDDSAVQACITALSATFLWRTGQCPQDGSFPSQSLFNTPQQFNEVYDGNGSSRIFLRHRPIQSVSSLVIGNQTIPQSLGYGQSGFVIDGTKASISILGGGGGNSVPFNFTNLGGFGCGFGVGFWEGIQNVAVTYTAGYGQGVVGDSLLVFGGLGYAVNDTFTISGGTTLATGIVTVVNGSGTVTGYTVILKGAGYSNASISTTTATSGIGTGLTIQLVIYPPLDIEMAIRKSAALRYKQKDWIGRVSTSMAQGAGTTSYSKDELDSDVELLIINYTNWAVV